MALNTTDRAACLARAKERSDNADTAENDELIGDLLDASQGEAPDGTKHYRPYLVAARVLDITTMRVEGAPAAEFRSVDKNIEALLNLQAAEDARLDLTVEARWQADAGTAGNRTSSITNKATF